MNSRMLADHDGQRTFAIIFDRGDEVIAALHDFARNNAVHAAQFTAVGAFSDAVLAYFDWPAREYRKFNIAEQVEVLTLAGDVSEDDNGAPKVHAHVIVGRSDTTTRGGHLIEAHVRPTLEVILTDSPAHLRRRHDPESGLALIRV